MKHAWLIIAHNEFEILQLLVSALDDPDNDIFVHIDKKVRELPSIHTKKSRLVILQERLDVRWGDPSQIACELLLMRTACNCGPYSRYHIISGTHLPLKSMEYIHSYFEDHDGQELMHLWDRDERDIGNKLQRYNLFVRGFTDPSPLVRRISQFLWASLQVIQKRLKIRRFRDEKFIKSDNWLSLTEGAVKYLIENESLIRKKYRYSYCGDEYFVATELNHAGQFKIVDTYQLLKVSFIQYNPKVYTMEDYGALADSDCLFARKFSSSHKDVAKLILNRYYHE